MAIAPRARGRMALLVAVSLVALSACGNRLERKTVDGVDCIVVSNGAGKPEHVDCNWDDAKPPPRTPTDAG